MTAEYGREWGKSLSLPVGAKLSEFGEDEPEVDAPFRELVGSLMWLSRQTRPDIENAVRAVARYYSSSKLVRSKVALGILGYARETSHFGISFRGVHQRD